MARDLPRVSRIGAGMGGGTGNSRRHREWLREVTLVNSRKGDSYFHAERSRNYEHQKG